MLCWMNRLALYFPSFFLWIYFVCICLLYFDVVFQINMHKINQQKCFNIFNISIKKGIKWQQCKMTHVMEIVDQQQYQTGQVIIILMSIMVLNVNNNNNIRIWNSVFLNSLYNVYINVPIEYTLKRKLIWVYV